VLDDAGPALLPQPAALTIDLADPHAPHAYTRQSNAVAVTALCPSQLHARMVALPNDMPSTAAALDTTAASIALLDVTAAAHALGVLLSSIVGQVWAVRLQVGQPLVVELRITNQGEQDEQVQFSIKVTDVAGSSGLLGLSGDGSAGGAGAGAAAPGGGGGSSRAAQLSEGVTATASSSAAAAAAAAAAEPARPLPDPSEGGILLTGVIERALLTVKGGGGVAVHKLLLLPMRPGLYQLAVHDIVGRSRQGGGAGGGEGDCSSALYLTQDRLCVLVQ